MHHMQKWTRDLNLRTKILGCLKDIREMKTCMQGVHCCIHNMQKAERTHYAQPSGQAKKYSISIQ